MLEIIWCEPEHPSATAPSEFSPKVGAWWSPDTLPGFYFFPRWVRQGLEQPLLHTGDKVFTSPLLSRHWGAKFDFFWNFHFPSFWWDRQKGERGGHRCPDPSLPSCQCPFLNIRIIKPSDRCEPDKQCIAMRKKIICRDIFNQPSWVLLPQQQRVRMMLPEGDTRVSQNVRCLCRAPCPVHFTLYLIFCRIFSCNLYFFAFCPVFLSHSAVCGVSAAHSCPLHFTLYLASQDALVSKWC